MSKHAQLLAVGVEHHRAGRLHEAQQIYRQVTAAEPDNADAHSLLGAVCVNLNEFDAAAVHLADAIRINPRHNAALDNLGVMLAQQGRYEEAIERFDQSLAIAPNQPHTLMNLAGSLARAGRIDAAVAAYRRVAALVPDALRAHSELAELLLQGNRPAEAVEHYRHVARLRPDDPKAHFELAALLSQTGNPQLAEAEYRETLRLKPDSAETCVNLGGLLIQADRLDEAVELFRRAIQMRPHFAEAYLNLGVALRQQGDGPAALDALQRSVDLKPELSEAHNNLGNVLADEGKFAEAARSYEQAVSLAPASVDAQYNLGIALLKQNQVEAAEQQFGRAIALVPEHGESHHNRSAAMLLRGEFEAGFAEYEWRFRSREFPPLRMRWPLWNGGPLEGRTIVLVAEQGLGDTIQFIRYAALVKRQAARVIVECPRDLHTVLARTAGVDEIIASDTPPPAADCCVPLLSVPHRLGTTLATIPADVPYVFVDEELIATWQSRLADQEGFRIGIVWRGSPRLPGDRFRSVALERFEPLARLPGVRLFSMQMGPGAEELTQVSFVWQVVDLKDRLTDFRETAAVLRNLDLLISVDTAAAHLAGALGVPAWIALPFVPDWRWLQDRDDSPWYPTVRLFRQSEWLEWDEVFERMAAEVAAILSGQAAAPEKL